MSENAFNEEEIQDKLKDLNVEWTVVGGNTLERVFRFDDFKSALAFVNKISESAEEMNHHPDIHLSWGKVVVSITTHEVGGLTEKDFEFANKI